MSRSSRCLLPVLAAVLAAVASPAAAQIKLFPEETPATPPAEPVPAEPAAPQTPATPAPPSDPAAPVPPAFTPQEVEAHPIEAAPSIDDIGAEAGDLGALWRRSDPDVVVPLLEALPVATTNRPLQLLTRRLLLTGSSLRGEARSGAAFAARVDRLLQMGAIEAAGELLAQLKPDEGGDELRRLALETALLTGDDAAACRPLTPEVAAAPNEFLAKLQIYCRLVENDAPAAALGLELMRENEEQDPAFAALVSQVLKASPADPLEIDKPSALHLALLRRLERPAPAKMVASAPPSLQAAMLKDELLSQDVPLELAEAAFNRGLIDGAVMRRAYLAAKDEDQGDVLARIEFDWSPQTRAQLVKKIEKESVVFAKAELLAAGWQAAKGLERQLLAEVFADAFRALPRDRALAWAAPMQARAMLVTGNAPLAIQWRVLLRTEKTAQNEVAAHRLESLFALLDPAKHPLPPLDRELVAEWQEDLRAANTIESFEVDNRLERQFVLIEATGGVVPVDAWQAIINPPLEATTQVMPQGRIFRLLDSMIRSESRGESILLALHLLNGQPESVHVQALRQALAALGHAGLSAEAGAIAVHAAISAGL